MRTGFSGEGCDGPAYSHAQLRGRDQVPQLQPGRPRPGDLRLARLPSRRGTRAGSGRPPRQPHRADRQPDRGGHPLRGLRDKPEGTLSIISPKWIGSNDVGDAIVAFSTRYPKIRIRFEVGGMSERAYDFLDQGFDVAFHTRHVRDSNLLLRKIADLNFMLCASPAYLHRAGRPTQVTELTEHDCLM